MAFELALAWWHTGYPVIGWDEASSMALTAVAVYTPCRLYLFIAWELAVQRGLRGRPGLQWVLGLGIAFVPGVGIAFYVLYYRKKYLTSRTARGAMPFLFPFLARHEGHDTHH